MVVFLLAAILAVLLFGAPQILDWAFQGGAVVLMLLAVVIAIVTGFSLLAGLVQLFQNPWEMARLAGYAAVFAAWIWGFAKFKFVRWGFVALLVATIAVAQFWPVLKAVG